jgi:hypothetical protein
MTVLGLRSYVHLCGSGRFATGAHGEIGSHMNDRIRRAWMLILAVAPITAVALVEAAMRRW